MGLCASQSNQGANGVGLSGPTATAAAKDLASAKSSQYKSTSTQARSEFIRHHKRHITRDYYVHHSADRVLGSGMTGSVKPGTNLSTGLKYAIKSINKVTLTDTKSMLTVGFRRFSPFPLLTWSELYRGDVTCTNMGARKCPSKPRIGRMFSTAFRH